MIQYIFIHKSFNPQQRCKKTTRNYGINYFRFIFPNTFSVHEYKFTFTFEADDVFIKATEGKVHIVFATIT